MSLWYLLTIPGTAKKGSQKNEAGRKGPNHKEPEMNAKESVL